MLVAWHCRCVLGLQLIGVEGFRETAGEAADDYMASMMGHFGQVNNLFSGNIFINLSMYMK